MRRSWVVSCAVLLVLWSISMGYAIAIARMRYLADGVFPWGNLLETMGYGVVFAILMYASAPNRRQKDEP